VHQIIKLLIFQSFLITERYIINHSAENKSHTENL